METKQYKELVEKEVHKEYKKANKTEIKNVVENEKKEIRNQKHTLLLTWLFLKKD